MIIPIVAMMTIWRPLLELALLSCIPVTRDVKLLLIMMLLMMMMVVMLVTLGDVIRTSTS